MTNYIGNKPADVPVSVDDLPTGITNAKLQNSQITINGSAVSLGGSTTIATKIDWQSSIKTGDFTAVSGEGYFINTTSTTITMTLPSSPSAGDIVSFKDYANTFDSNALTIGRAGSNINGLAQDGLVSEEGIAVTVVYADATKGWLVTRSGLSSLTSPS